MRILIDTREQRPFSFTRFPGVAIERAALPAGDYSLPGFEDRVAIERKELNDLIACLKGDNRDRFERELTRARHYELFAVVVEASLEDVSKGRYRSEMKPHAALQSIFAFQVRYRVPFVWAGGREAAEYATYSLLEKYRTEIEKRFEQLNRERKTEHGIETETRAICRGIPNRLERDPGRDSRRLLAETS
ncbi:MAG: ERCC4 domain-containing protein [Syntrophobacteraceae bacterium]|jgi:ERCC4-type nuclease